MRWSDGIADSTDMSLSELRETVKGREAWCAAVHGVTKSDMTWQLSNNNNAHQIVSKSRHQSYYEKQSTKLNAEAAFFGFWCLLIRSVSSSEIHTVVKILSFVFGLCLWCILPYISVLVLCSQVQRSFITSGFLSQKVFPHIQVIMEFTSVHVCYLYGLN